MNFSFCLTNEYLFRGLNDLAGKYYWLDKIVVFFAHYLPYILVAFLILLLLKNFKKNKKIILGSFLTAGLGWLIVLLIRLFYYHPRPFVENQVNLISSHSLTSSFPSAHAVFLFSISSFIYFYSREKCSGTRALARSEDETLISSPTTRHFWRRVSVWFLIFSFLIVVSRVFAGVHWPLDILVGAILGIFIAFLANRLFIHL